MTYLRSDEAIRKEELSRLQGELDKNKGTPSYNLLFTFVKLQLEITKDKLLDSKGDDLVKTQGEAIALRNLVRVLRNPIRPTR